MGWCLPAQSQWQPFMLCDLTSIQHYYVIMYSWQIGAVSRSIAYLMHTKSVVYAAKNHMNCEWADGIPYSVYTTALLIGLASFIVYFRNRPITSLIATPTKKTIWSRNCIVVFFISRSAPDFLYLGFPRGFHSSPCASPVWTISA